MMSRSFCEIRNAGTIISEAPYRNELRDWFPQLDHEPLTSEEERYPRTLDGNLPGAPFRKIIWLKIEGGLLLWNLRAAYRWTIAGEVEVLLMISVPPIGTTCIQDLVDVHSFHTFGMCWLRGGIAERVPTQLGQWIFELTTHEARESIIVQGKRIFDPHKHDYDRG